MYLHHLIEEEDAARRKPPGVVVFTPLSRPNKHKFSFKKSKMKSTVLTAKKDNLNICSR